MGASGTTGTEKLYWASRDASFELEGASIAVAEHLGKTSLVLPRTIFYPEGGGQLGDSGEIVLGGTTRIAIADTQIDDAGVIHHILADALSDDDRARLSGAALAMTGTIDAARRRDNTAQHTAQHALSRALADVARAETVSARLGATTCTIDVSRPSIPDGELHRAEDLVNGLVSSNVDVRALYPDAEALAKLPLRKQPKVTEGVIRVIEIEAFDMTPCGGTHCSRTGEIGQVRIIGTEKYKGGLRLTFHAGLRALADARSSHAALAGLAAELTCGLGDVPAQVGKLRAELKGARAQIDLMRAELAELVANDALARLPDASTSAGPIVLHLLRAGDDVSALRVLAGKLASEPRVIALAGAIDPATGELVVVVQRGASTKLDCGAFIKAETKERGGRGGGRPERAEARFPRGTSLEALAARCGA